MMTTPSIRCLSAEPVTRAMTWRSTEYELFYDPGAVQDIGLDPANAIGDGFGAKLKA